MNPRNFLNFFKSKTGQVTGFGILFFVGACLLMGVLYFRHSTTTITNLSAPKIDKTEDKTQKPSTWYSHEPDADFANKHPVEAETMVARPPARLPPPPQFFPSPFITKMANPRRYRIPTRLTDG